MVEAQTDMSDELFEVGSVLKSLWRAEGAPLHVLVCGGQYHPMVFSGPVLFDGGDYECVGEFHDNWNKRLIGTGLVGWEQSSLEDVVKSIKKHKEAANAR